MQTRANGRVVVVPKKRKELVDRLSTSENAAKVLATIPEREATVLILRHGLFGNQRHTLQLIGDKFSLTRERIRQIQGKAERKMRHPLRYSRL